MKSAQFAFAACLFSMLAVGCCHRHGSGCYDPTTGLVSGGRCGLFDTCGVGCLGKKSDCGCEKKKSKKSCGCDKQHCCDPCANGHYPLVGEGGLTPHGGYYSDGGIIYGDSTSSYCPECEMNGVHSYPELMAPHEVGPPMPAPAAEPGPSGKPAPLPETSISIPPASYVVPQGSQWGPTIPQHTVQPVSAF